MPQPSVKSAAARDTVLPVLALLDEVMFPRTVSPLYIGREQTRLAVEQAYASRSRAIFLTLKKNDESLPVEKAEDIQPVGTVCRLVQMFRMPDGNIKGLFEGTCRATVADFSLEAGCPTARVRSLDDIPGEPAQLRTLTELVHEAVRDMVRSRRKAGKLDPESLQPVLDIDDPSVLADTLAARLPVTSAQKQKVLELLDTARRLEEVYGYLSYVSTSSALERRIKAKVREQMEKTQREYYLSEQLKVINKELGRDSDPQEELDGLERRLKEKDLPEPARERGLAEVSKLRSMTAMAPEYTILRTYVDWILDLPWNSLRKTDIDIQAARRILDDNHYGIEKPKERILEYLAVQKLSGGVKGPILCLVGPPGVGKTSLAQSVAQATGREYLRLSLGGVRDEAEIRGHRRTYIGALPGKIIQSLKRAGSSNPLFCLDEIDKMTCSERGDPAAALLEVLDPEQNCSYMDHYLDLDYDLSRVFFITTANSLEGIPAPLLDRMEVIELHSYLETEKFHIARNFLIPRQTEENSLRPGNISIPDETVLAVIRNWTREAGVRGLERRIAKLCRRTAVQILERKDPDFRLTVSPEDLPGIFGAATSRHDSREESPCTGVCTALAWTPLGGDILFVEAGLMAGSGAVVTTGKLGEVMQESARAALSYVRAHAAELGLRPDFHKKIDIHVHVPDGATSKDGPSAGITIAAALASALLGIPARNDTAMTGEISLRGRVLPVGGLREKLLAARRAGIRRIILPRPNERDIADVPAEIRDGLELIYVDQVREVLVQALTAQEKEIFPGSAVPALTDSLRAGAEGDGEAAPKPARRSRTGKTA